MTKKTKGIDNTSKSKRWEGIEQSSPKPAASTFLNDKQAKQGDKQSSDTADMAVSTDKEATGEALHETIAALEKALEVEKLTAKQSIKEEKQRAQAEISNLTKRCRRDVEEAHKYALEKFAGDLLPVVDNLERALTSLVSNVSVEAENEKTKKMKQGIELTLSIFEKTLKKYNVVPVDPTGEIFDPTFHEAVSVQPDTDVPHNTVIKLLQKGYLLNGRLLRAAMVIVSDNGDK